MIRRVTSTNRTLSC